MRLSVALHLQVQRRNAIEGEEEKIIPISLKWNNVFVIESTNVSESNVARTISSLVKFFPVDEFGSQTWIGKI